MFQVRHLRQFTILSLKNLLKEALLKKNSRRKYLNRMLVKARRSANWATMAKRTHKTRLFSANRINYLLYNLPSLSLSKFLGRMKEIVEPNLIHSLLEVHFKVRASEEVGLIASLGKYSTRLRSRAPSSPKISAKLLSKRHF